MVKDKKEMTNIKICCTKQFNTSLITYQQSYGKTVDMQCSHFLVPFPSRSYTFWILRLIGFNRNHQMYEAALLTRYYTQHVLRPFIDSEINHQRHFIKIHFKNKEMDFIDLPKIFHDKSVTSSILDYFQNSD